MKSLASVAGELTLRETVLAQVGVEHRKMASDAEAFFTDRPCAPNIDDELGSIKLAAHLARKNVTREELQMMVLWLDERLKFRPTISDYLEAIDVARSELRRAEIRTYRTYRDSDGLVWAASPAVAEANGLTEVDNDPS